jgi:two-component system phosphate regulon sensor histidine kinase PhoR
MSELAHCAAVGITALAVGYFIPRSRDVITRIDALRPLEIEAADVTQDATLDEIFAAMPVAILIVESEGLIRRANYAAGELFGRTHGQMAGRAVVEATGSSDLDHLVAEVRENGDITRVVEYKSTRLEATLRVYALNMSDSSIALIALDETTSVNVERVRQEFLANISHELRSPLAGTKLMVETLLADHNDLQTREYFLPRLLREINRMVELVEHLLDVARSEAGQIRLSIQTVDFKRLVNDNLELLEARIAKRGLRLERELTQINFKGDPARLAQVVLNFVENAMRHTPSGGVITVRTTIVENELVLTVADTGSGVPYRDLPHIFERFYVVDRSRSKDRGGLGVGLAIVKRNVEAHGGRVDVVSEFGSGSTFYAYLPIAADTTSYLDDTAIHSDTAD